MKNSLNTKLIVIAIAFAFLFQSCATIIGGKITTCQTHTDPPRQVRAGYLVLDVICGLVPLGVDFITKAIYKPCDKQK